MKKAKIVFCPYQYLLDPAIRESTTINFTNSIVIFDEVYPVHPQSNPTNSLGTQY